MGGKKKWKKNLYSKKEEEKEQEDNKLRDLDGNEIKNDNVPQKGVQ